VKSRQTYKVLTILGAFLILLGIPVNRMYLGESWGLRLVTLNYFLFGVWTDLFFMDKRFDEAMARRGFINTQIRNAAGK